MLQSQFSPISHHMNGAVRKLGPSFCMKSPEKDDLSDDLKTYSKRVLSFLAN